MDAKPGHDVVVRPTIVVLCVVFQVSADRIVAGLISILNVDHLAQISVEAGAIRFRHMLLGDLKRLIVSQRAT